MNERKTHIVSLDLINVVAKINDYITQRFQMSRYNPERTAVKTRMYEKSNIYVYIRLTRWISI